MKEKINKQNDKFLSNISGGAVAQWLVLNGLCIKRSMFGRCQSHCVVLLGKLDILLSQSHPTQVYHTHRYLNIPGCYNMLQESS